MSKVKMALEIHQAMSFLGIPAIEFMTLKAQFGGLAGLHTEMGNRLF